MTRSGKRWTWLWSELDMRLTGLAGSSMPWSLRIGSSPVSWKLAGIMHWNKWRHLEARIAAMGERSAPISAQNKTELMALGDDVRTLWDHPDASVQLKKRILRT